jgi:hypothetical protein
MIYRNLWLTSLTPEQHERTCDYWYTITQAGTPHTAFRTREALFRWLARRGLTMTADLAPHGKHSTQRLSGEYEKRSHMNAADMPRNWIEPPFLAMDNGQYTEAVATFENGRRVIHTMNCNAARPVFDHWIARNHEDRGLPGLPGAQVYA